jgi:coenzyme PQQ precursor peptide PqqA
MKWITPDYQEIKLGAEVTGYVNTDPGEALLEVPVLGALGPVESRASQNDRTPNRVRREKGR